jgi:hypothetical protein
MDEIDKIIDDSDRASVEARLWQKVKKGAPDECWVWQGRINPQGQAMISVKERMHAVARVSYALYGEKPLLKGRQVCHRCDNPPCINPAHLFQGTAIENAQDSCRKLRRRRKINPEDVRIIRRVAIDNKGVAECMIRYNLTAQHVRDVARKAKGAWDWLPD